MAYEKNGNVDMAIITYEENIESDYSANHAFERLMILYRRNKDYQNEIRVINRALEVFPKYYEYKERLRKATDLARKNKITVK